LKERWSPRALLVSIIFVLMLKALRHPPLARLWIGQALSSVGDEIYRVGLTWLAVGLIGADTGYLTAGQFAALMLLSFVGGKWADDWEPIPTMIAVDLARAAVVLIPVIYSFFAPVPLSLFVVVALVIAALSAFFDPALQAALPRFSPSVPVLRAATGLMSTTIRMARMIGPGLIGVLSGILPPIHFFTVNACSYLLSAAFVRSIRKDELPCEDAPRLNRKKITLKEAVFSGFQIAQTKPGMSFIIFSKALAGGLWHLGFTLGFALLVQELAPNDVRSFGLLVAAYGAGNLAAALYVGNRERRQPVNTMYAGYIWLGIGFAMTAIIPDLKWMIALAAFSAMGGPMSEINFSDIIQIHFQSRDIVRIYRLRMALETGCALLLLMASPIFFKMFGPRLVIASTGVATVVTGLVGMFLEQWAVKKNWARRQT
jgi:MFS transporter, DHA3 family, macrolide efflux protein